ncbi:MAG: PhoU domain-containing protein [Planctomycetota bacterium]
MTTTPEAFENRIAQIRASLVEQGRRVEALCERAFESLFTGDTDAGAAVERDDDVIDRADVEIEKASVQLLTQAARETVQLEAKHLREVVTVVKVNNEFERIADAAVAAVQSRNAGGGASVTMPPTFRVMTNSVLGIIRDTTRSYERADGRLAKLTLDAEDTVATFKSIIVKEAEERMASGGLSVEAAFFLHEVAGLCERMADHCSNVAEQVLWTSTGTIVRHTGTGWVEVDGVKKDD